LKKKTCTGPKKPLPLLKQKKNNNKHGH